MALGSVLSEYNVEVSNHVSTFPRFSPSELPRTCSSRRFSQHQCWRRACSFHVSPLLIDITYPSWELEPPASITPPRPENETPLIIIDDEPSMLRLCEELKHERSFAVDLEHHNYRSYQGFTCLIQVSVVDAHHV